MKKHKEINMNTRIVVSLSDIGKEQYCKYYNESLPKMYRIDITKIKNELRIPLWEFCAAFGELYKNIEHYNACFSERSSLKGFMLETLSEGVWGSVENIFVPSDAKVFVHWETEGKKLMAEVLALEVEPGFRTLEYSEYPDGAEMLFIEYAYIVRSQCFNGSVRQPLVWNNAINFLL